MACIGVVRCLVFKPSIDVGEHFYRIYLRAMARSFGQCIVVFVFDLLQGLPVLFPNGFLSDGSIPQGHAVGAMAEDLHDGNETHSTVEQRGGIGVSEPVGGDLCAGIESFTRFSKSGAIMMVSRFSISVVFDEPLLEGARICLLELLYER